MPVPLDDTLCRFVRPQDWSKRDNRPKAGAFKQAALFVWNVESLQAQSVRIEDLQVEHLVDSGQAHHRVSDYMELARKASEVENVPFSVQVEWRPEDEYVSEPWREWRYAHVQVEAVEGPEQFLGEFRRILAQNSRHLVSPD